MPTDKRTTTAAILWRRLDMPGHDACRLDHTADGWCLQGAAVFSQEGMPACLDYRVACDRAWRTREGAVHGWLGGETINLQIEHAGAGRWLLNGDVIPNLDACTDLDFGFTPATNLLQLRRIALGVGEAADVPVAWLDVTVGTLSRLDQRYQRKSQTAYGYEAPRFDYNAVLDVDAAGFARRYPGLWEAI
jgi:hypothetical protein